MITAIFASLVAALPTFAPVLVQIGLYLLNLFVSNASQKAANEKAFLDAIAQHLNDGVLSAGERMNAWTQRQDLIAKAKALDEAAAAAAKTKTEVQK